jgi:hypothetical protein
MTGKNIEQRLERLEDELMPVEGEEPILTYVFVTPARQVASTHELKIMCPARPVKKRW